MDEKDFELLQILDETRNVTKAAERLFITQSALSKKIKALEGELGAELVLRSRQGVHFTPAGETALQHSRAAAQQLEQLRRDLDIQRGEVSGTLNAGISENFALYRLPDILASYHRQYPKVHLHITTGPSRTLYRQMVSGELDLAVVRGEYPWNGVQFLLSMEAVCLVYNKEYEHTPLRELLYVNHRTDPAQEVLLTRWLNENGLSSRPIGFGVDSVTTCVEMVKRGLGWALLPEIALSDYHGVVRPCSFANGEPLNRRSYILCQKDAQTLPQVQAFMTALKQTR